MLVVLLALLALVAAALLAEARSSVRVPGTGRIRLTPFASLVGVFLLSIVLPSVYLVDSNTNSAFLPLAAGLGIIVGFALVATARSDGSNFGIDVLDDKYWRRVLRGAWLLFGFLTALSLFRYDGIPPIIDSTIESLSGGDARQIAADTSLRRLELTKGAWFDSETSGIAGTLGPVVRTAWPFLVTMLLAGRLNAPTTALRKRFRTLLVLAVPLGMLFVAGDYVRSGIVWGILFVLAGYSLLRPVRPRIVGILMVTLLIVFSGVTLLSYKGSQSSDQQLRNVTIGRFDDNYSNDVLIYEAVESGIWELRLGGETMESLASALPGVRAGVPVALRVHQELRNGGYESTTFASPTALGRLFLDWGFIGVLAGFAVLSAVSLQVGRLVQRWATRGSPVSVAVFGGATTAAGQAVLGGLVGFATSLTILFVLAVIAVALTGKRTHSLDDPRTAVDLVDSRSGNRTGAAVRPSGTGWLESQADRPSRPDRFS